MKLPKARLREYYGINQQALAKRGYINADNYHVTLKSVIDWEVKKALEEERKKQQKRPRVYTTITSLSMNRERPRIEFSNADTMLRFLDKLNQYVYVQFKGIEAHNR